MPTNKIKMLRQPRYVGGRNPVNSAFIPPLEKAVLAEMSKYKASRSFVIATCVAVALGVTEQIDYHTMKTFYEGTKK